MVSLICLMLRIVSDDSLMSQGLSRCSPLRQKARVPDMRCHVGQHVLRALCNTPEVINMKEEVRIFNSFFTMLISPNTRSERLIRAGSAAVQSGQSVPSLLQSPRAAHLPGRPSVHTSMSSNMEPPTTDQRTSLAETSPSSAHYAIQYSPQSLGDLRERRLFSLLMLSGATTCSSM
jgi:hypothetical protein